MEGFGMKNEKNIVNKQKNVSFLYAIIIIILLSMLTFNFNHESAIADEKNSNINETNNTTCGNCKGYNKETIFNQNVTFIKDAIVDYFTNERLPQKINDSVKMSLKEMIEKKLVYYIVDSNEKNCSLTDSYVEVTKYDSEYVFKIYLSCSDISDYVLVHKGCSDYCENKTCETKVEPVKEPEIEETKTYEYEYAKSNSCKMTDWSEWSDWKTTKEEIKDLNYKREETKLEVKNETTVLEENYETITKYNCDQLEGYTLVGDKCIKSIGIIDEKDANENPLTYNCDKYEGYELDSTGNNCVKSTTIKDEKDADENPLTYNCDKYEGYILDSTGKNCIKETSSVDKKAADENPTTYNCDKYEGYILDNTGKNCIKETSSVDEKPAEENPTTYNCNKYEGYELSGNICVKQIATQDIKDATPVTTYNCNNYSGYTLDSSNKCVKTTTSTDTINATPNYSTREVSYGCRKQVCSTKQVLDCSSGSCVMKDEKTCSYVDSTCYKDESYISSYSCPSGYSLSGTTCTKTISTTDTKDATPVTTYNCNNYGGYTLTGNKCVKNVTTTDTKPADENPKTYNCDKYKDYKLSGKKCVKTTTTTDTKPAEENPKTYNCDAYKGYKLYGNKCVKSVCDICTKDAEKEDINVCPEGYTENENKCTKTITERKEYKYYRYSTRSCEGGSRETKWSEDSNDSTLKNMGFSRTGRKRVLDLVKYNK